MMRFLCCVLAYVSTLTSCITTINAFHHYNMHHVVLKTKGYNSAILPTNTIFRETQYIATSTTSLIHQSLKNYNKNSIINTIVFSSSSSSTTISEKESSTKKSSNIKIKDEVKDAIIVGGGPAGLLSSIMLLQKIPSITKIKIYERRQKPPSSKDKSIWNDVARFYLMGIGLRGQKALDEYNVLNDFKDVSIPVLGRMDWSPESEEGVERIFTERAVSTEILPREKLVGVLSEHIEKNYKDKIEIYYLHEVTPIDFGSKSHPRVTLRVSKCSPDSDSTKIAKLDTMINNENDVTCNVDDSFIIKTDLVIGVDGTARSIANAIELDNQKNKSILKRPFNIKRYIDDNQRVYKTIPMKLPKTWRYDLNYSARTKNGVNIDALPADSNGNYCAVLLIKEDHPFAKANSDVKELRSFFEEYLAQFNSLIDDETMNIVAKKPSSFLPGFRYVSPTLHYKERTVILGDCAHTVKPYFGLGANSALEDVQILGNCIDESDTIYDALQLFSKKRSKEIKILVQISRSLDRPGFIGAFTFIIPIILDSIFQRVPFMGKRLFKPNTLALFQQPDMKFTSIRYRKRLDRMVQLSLIGSGIWSLSKIVTLGLKYVCNTLNIPTKYVTLSVALAVVGAYVMKNSSMFQKEIAPADVMNKSKSAL